MNRIKQMFLMMAGMGCWLSVSAQTGTWDKEKYPTAEPLPKQELLDEFRWQPGVSNQPVGVARGIYPGRVVMTRYPEVCRWKGRWNVEDDQWFLPENTDLEGVCQMMSKTLQTLTGTKSDKKAWKKIFEYYHHQRFGTKKGAYKPGEVVAVKVNVNNAKAREKQSNMSDEAPQVIMAMVRQLVKAAGVRPEDIIIFDARRPFAPEILNLVWGEYPDVTFLQDDPGIRDYQPVNPKTGDYSKLVKPKWKKCIEFSHGKFDGARLIPEQVYNATYLVNLAMLKLHSYPYNYMEGGDEGQTAVTMTAKNHAGSVRAPWEMHHFLNTQQDGKPHAYSPLVDLNASPYLGAKTILYMLDGLYCGRKHASFPLHFPNAPFFNQVEPYENTSWPASLLASLDEVALESVGLDLLYAQSLNNEETGYYNVPRVLVRNQASDYLLEMADPQNAPSGIKYVQDGKPVESLGVFEHWDSPETMRYSRNIDPKNGQGIEFIYLPMGSAASKEKQTLAPLLSLYMDKNVPADGPKEDLNVGRGNRRDHATQDPMLPGGGLSRYPMIYIGEGYNRIFIVADGKVVWKYDTGPGNELDDIWMLKNGDLLFTRMGWAAKVSPDKRELWRYDCKEGEEIHTMQPIDDDEAIMLINAFPARIWRFNHKTGKTVWEKEIDFHTNSTHIQSRRMRFTKDNTLLLCYLGENKVVEYDTDWRVVRTFNVPKPWAAIRLKNGNTLITLEDERRTIEVDKNDKVVWEIRLDELPEQYRLHDCQSVCRLQNGNTILCSRGNGGRSPQLVEVTPDKQVVWVLNDWQNLGPATSVQILSEEGFSEVPGDLER